MKQHPATVEANQPEAVGHRQGIGLPVHDSGSADGGMAAGSWPGKSVDPELADLLQKEVDKLTWEIIGRVKRLSEIQTLCPRQISETQRYRLMNSGCYLTTLYTRNERDISEAG